MNQMHQFLLDLDILFDLNYQKIIFYLILYFVYLPNLKVKLFTFYYLLVIMELLLFFIFHYQIDIYFLLFQLHHLINLINHLNLCFYLYLFQLENLFQHTLVMFIFMSIFHIVVAQAMWLSFILFNSFDQCLGKENHS